MPEAAEQIGRITFCNFSYIAKLFSGLILAWMYVWHPCSIYRKYFIYIWIRTDSADSMTCRNTRNKCHNIEIEDVTSTRCLISQRLHIIFIDLTGVSTVHALCVWTCPKGFSSMWSRLLNQGAAVLTVLLSLNAASPLGRNKVSHVTNLSTSRERYSSYNSEQISIE